MTTKNQTEQDAWKRYSDAHMGAHAGSTKTYLLALRGYLYRWIAEIDTELGARDAKEAIADRDENSEERSSTLPPVLAGNQEARANATKHFQETRRILRGIR